MTHVRTLIALAAMAGFASVASAQSTAAPMPADVNKADVKADAKTAVKAGGTEKGELPKGAATKPMPATASTKAKADVKAEAKAAEKGGTTAKGDGPSTYSGPEKAATGNRSGTTRDEVKADAAMSKGKSPAGEAKTVNTEVSVSPAVTSPAAAKK